MPFSSEQIGRLTDIISEFVPLAILLDLAHGGVPLDLESWRKQHIGRYRDFSAEVVNAYAGRNKVPLLARALYRRFHRDDVVATKFVEFCKDPADVNVAYQAAFVLRANTLTGAELRQFLAEAEPRVCVVLAPADRLKKGTGFLVGPDLIVTARHTLEDHIVHDEVTDHDQIAPNTQLPVAVFDHLYGDPISTANPNDPDLRCVPFALDWLVESSRILDFALAKLSEPIGLESYAGNGGRRRMWFDYETIDSISPDERINIPQHPDGYIQQHDFGRYVETVEGGTRIRYTTETFPGSSGAPCFDGRHRLVAMHNSVYQPHEVPVFNQAIRFDHIANRIAKELTATTKHAAAKSELWSVTAAPQPPRPILGRRKLIDWIEAASAEKLKLSDRVFVVEGTEPLAGRGFSIEILRAARRDSQDPVVALGNERGQDGRRTALPQLADDALRTILQQLPFAVRSSPFPPRPAREELGDAMLNRWRDHDLPRRFSELLALNRRQNVDARNLAAERANQIRSILGATHPAAVTEEGLSAIERQLEVVRRELAALEKLAQSPDHRGVVQNRWERIWIAVVITGDTRLSAESTELLAALMKSPAEELVRIRWLLIGNVPPALKTLSSRGAEHLDPRRVGVNDCVRCFQQIAASLGFTPSEQGLGGVWGLMQDPAQRSKTVSDPLVYLQEVVTELIPLVKAIVRER